MKSIYKILAALVIICGVSCKKELYKAPIGLLTPDQVNTDPKLGTVKSSVLSSYQLLSSTISLVSGAGIMVLCFATILFCRISLLVICKKNGIRMPTRHGWISLLILVLLLPTVVLMASGVMIMKVYQGLMYL